MTVEQEAQSVPKRKRRIWPWLLISALVLLIVAGIYAYLEIIAMIEDLGRLWDDLVQLFWLIVPGEQPNYTQTGATRRPFTDGFILLVRTPNLRN